MRALLLVDGARLAVRAAVSNDAANNTMSADADLASGMSTGTAKTPKAVEGRSPASPVANGETPKA